MANIFEKKIVLIGAINVLSFAAYADFGQTLGSNLSTAAVNQVNTASQAATTAVEQAPTKLLDQAMAANQSTAAATSAASTQAAGAQQSVNPPAATLPTAQAIPNSVNAPAVPEILVKGSGGNASDEDPYTQYPEGLGNYNRNAHPASEELTSQSELIADDSVHDDEKPKEAFNGIYLEVNGVLAHSNGSDQQDNLLIGSSQNFNLNDNDFGLGLSFGYGAVFGGFYLGGELFGHYLPVDIDGFDRTVVGGNITLAEVESTYDFGAALKLGWQISRNVLFYGLIGTDAVNFDITSENTPTFESDKVSKTEFGFMPGIGLEAILFAGLYIDLRYTYNWYPEIKDNYTRKTDGAQINNKYDLSRNNLWLGLGYHF